MEKPSKTSLSQQGSRQRRSGPQRQIFGQLLGGSRGLEAAGMDSLGEAISALAAIAAELRQIAADLRDLIGRRQSPKLTGPASPLTEVENPEGLAEEEP